MSHLQFYRAILSPNFIARQNRKCDMSCRTLQLCRINENWPISVHRIFASKLHRIERCSIRKRSCATVEKLRDTPRHICDFVARWSWATKSRDKIAGVTSVLTSASKLLRSSHALWNASADNEGGVCQFSPIRIKIGYHGNVPSAMAKIRSDWSFPPTYILPILGFCGNKVHKNAWLPALDVDEPPRNIWRR